MCNTHTHKHIRTNTAAGQGGGASSVNDSFTAFRAAVGERFAEASGLLTQRRTDPQIEETLGMLTPREREMLGSLAAERRRHAVTHRQLEAYDKQLPLLGLCVLSLAVLVFRRAS
jgi:hypothetical protein